MEESTKVPTTLSSFSSGTAAPGNTIFFEDIHFKESVECSCIILESGKGARARAGWLADLKPAFGNYFR